MDGKWKCRGCGGICYGLEGHNRCRGCTDLDQRKAVAAAHESGRLAGQEAMRERCMKVCSELILRARVCAGDDEGLRDLRCLESHMLQAIRALEVSDD